MDWQQLVSVILDELSRASEEHSCIMAATVLLDVLRDKGIKHAYPLTVKARLFNPRLTERLNKEPSPTPNLMAHLGADGCHMVAIGHGEGSSGQWSAHLVVVIPNGLRGKDAICDLTITQANVPGWGIHLRPILQAVRDPFTNGSEDIGVIINGSRVIYRAFPDDHSFEQASLWKRNPKRDSIVKRVLNRL